MLNPDQNVENWRDWFVRNVLAELPVVGPLVFSNKTQKEAWSEAGKCVFGLTITSLIMCKMMGDGEIHASNFGANMGGMAAGSAVSKPLFKGIEKGVEILYSYCSKYCHKEGGSYAPVNLAAEGERPAVAVDLDNKGPDNLRGPN